MKTLVLGANGMAGHTIALYFIERGHEVDVFATKPTIFKNNIIGNALDTNFLKTVIQNGNYDLIINCIGILNSDCEKDIAKTIFINSYLPHLLTEFTKCTKTKIIQMSTDCVFSGKKGSYSEYDEKDGNTLYDKSKGLGEIDDSKNITFRNSIIGPDMNCNGIGLFNWFMKQKKEIYGYTNVIWTGVTTLTLAKAMEESYYQNITGVYNLVNNKIISKFDLLNLFNINFKNSSIEIRACNEKKINKSLINNRKDFDFNVPDYTIMINEMRDWIIKHKDLYPHYNL